jgi:hypothetical protein
MGFGSRRRAGRRTNLALLALLIGAGVTGGLAFAIGGGWVGWAVAAHAVTGLGIVALAPWKAAISGRSLRRRSVGASASLVLSGLVLTVIVTGVGHASGLLVSMGPASAMQVHVGAALACLALATWHVVVRRTRPHRTDLSRRNLLRSGVLVGGTTAAYVATEGIVHVTGLRGSRRRASGSYERGSFRPDDMPVTQWLDDSVPSVDSERWMLRVVDGQGTRRLPYEELLGGDRRVRTILDCTGGWYAEQEWTGVLLSELLIGVEAASSIEVASATGYGRRLPAADAGRLLLATGVGGRPLSAGHGFPVRLVVPGRRGFWWVKWVDHVALSDTPWWWQTPFPLA